MTKTVPGFGVITWTTGQIPTGQSVSFLRGLLHGQLPAVEETRELLTTILRHIFDELERVEVRQWRIGQVTKGMMSFTIEVWHE